MGKVKIEKETPTTTITKTTKSKPLAKTTKPLRLYLFGVNRARLGQLAKERQINLDIVNNLSEADLLVTSKSYYRRKPQIIRDAETTKLPIYVLKSNTPPQIRQLLTKIYPSPVTEKVDSLKLALDEAEEAITTVKNGQEMIELSPQSAYIRRLQHLIAERNDLASKSLGKDPDRRVAIFRE